MISLVAATLALASLRPAPERVLLQTSAGGMIVALDREAAPAAVTQFEALVRAGVYDGVRIYRVEPGYLVQTSAADDRDAPLTEAQQALVRRIPAERSPLQHLRGRLSLAHPAGDPAGASSSFSLLLGPAPELDGDYVVFGEVEEGLDVLDEIAAVPTNAAHRPLIRVAIERAVVLPDAGTAQAQRWARRSLFSAVVAASAAGLRREIAALIAAMLFCTLALIAVGRVHERWVRAVRMLVLLLGGFGLLAALLPLGQRAPLLGAATFLAVVGLLKWMNRFELPPVARGAPAGEPARAPR